MDITGKIIFASEPRGGVSQRSSTNWKAQDFVIETHEQYPKKCNFSVFGEDRLKEFNINVGDELTVSLDIDAHEYNGRWYNDVRAWRVQRVDASAPAVPNAAPIEAGENNAPAEIAGEQKTEDDLPF